MTRPIALALSGGGVRAMAFHMGVLRRLAELGLLERVHRVSTVSGGSLLVGLIYRHSALRWPSSESFLSEVYPGVEKAICSRSLQLGAFKQLLNPLNSRYLLSRANLLAIELKKNWGMDVPLASLSLFPEWSINGTSGENGKRFRFKGVTIGDWDLGYAEAPAFALGDALAVSAAFPVGFGPLAVPVTGYDWKARPWGAPKATEASVRLPFKKLHLYDGGLYDNLGTEPFFHPGRQEPKHPGDYIVVSDAGAPLVRSHTPWELSPFRIKRMMDIMSEQSRGLRLRAFFNYLEQADDHGALLVIGTPVSGKVCAEAEFARSFPTSLRQLKAPEFDRLARYGYAVACEYESRRGLG